jgi:hypothetical protein
MNRKKRCNLRVFLQFASIINKKSNKYAQQGGFFGFSPEFRPHEIGMKVAIEVSTHR